MNDTNDSNNFLKELIKAIILAIVTAMTTGIITNHFTKENTVKAITKAMSTRFDFIDEPRNNERYNALKHYLEHNKNGGQNRLFFILSDTSRQRLYHR